MKIIKKLNKKILLPIAIIAVVVSGYFIWNTVEAKNNPDEEIKTTKATKGNVSVSLDVEGKTVIKSQDLNFEINGVIRGINVKEGDVVKPWQTLAYLDVREAQKNLESTLRDYSKERNDFEEGIQVTYADTVITDTFKRILEKNQWDLEKSVLDVELKDIARRKSYLTTSMGGTVVVINYQPGELTASGNTVITIVDEDSFHFETFVEDIEALKIKKDMAVRVSLDALEDEYFNGKVVFVSPLATIDENDLSTYKVIIEFNEIDKPLIDGLIGEAEIVSKEVTSVIKVLNTSVTREDGKSVVYVNNNGEWEKQEVVLGFTNGKEVEVKSGLNAGDEVIIW